MREQVAHTSCGYSIFGIVQGQTGWGFKQPGFVGDVRAHGRELDLDGHWRSLPTQTFL